MKKHSVKLLAGLLCSLTWLAGTAAAQDARAQAVLQQARAALGGEAQLKNIQSLIVQGTSRHTLHGPQEHTIEEQIELSFLLPDKFLKAKTLPGPNGSGETKIYEGVNDAQEWMDVDAKGGDVLFFQAQGQAQGQAPGQAHGQVQGQPSAGVARGAGFPANVPANVPGGHAVGIVHSRHDGSSGHRAEFARYLLAFALTAPSTMPVEWSYAGKAETPAGRADALEIKGADGFSMRLYLDEQTHLPLQMTYQTKAIEMGVTMAFEAVPLPVNGQPVGGQIHRGMPAFNIELPPPSGKAVEMQVRFSNYVNLAGWQFPQELSFSLDGQVVEEWVGLNWQINPGLSADHFQPRRK
jgi:hypothetical protein